MPAVDDAARNWRQGAGGSARLLARGRRDLILDELGRRGSVRVSELTTLLGVSDMTVRRDLDVLALAGSLEKVHGGATLIDGESARSIEPGFAIKSSKQTSEKEAIALRAAAMVRPGTAIGLTAGTTTWHLAGALEGVADLIVVTNSIRICETLLGYERNDLTVMLSGGVRTPSDALVGPLAVQALSSLHLDQVFMGVHGMSERAGFTTPNLLEAETNRTFRQASEHLVVLADHTKWGTVGLSTIAPLKDASAVVTDDLMPTAVRTILREHVHELVIAERQPPIEGGTATWPP
ncbi:MAG: DeoR/GlpR transcriptional regulator [Acidimicrobiia bacterium]|nr:DeoR/GlpR transcriptional regulator [Acidimicrobiia bacterium]